LKEENGGGENRILQICGTPCSTAYAVGVTETAETPIAPMPLPILGKY
jgi:hypothetical protein